MNHAIRKATIVAVFSTWVTSVSLSAKAENSEWRLKILERSEKPLVTKDHPDAADNKYGFEGGKVIKCDGFYHWFPSEMSGDPYWVKVRIAYWRSKDGDHWERIATVYETDGINSQNNGSSNIFMVLQVSLEHLDLQVSADGFAGNADRISALRCCNAVARKSVRVSVDGFAENADRI